VLFNWAYVYLTRRRHAQLIVGPAPLAEGAVERPAPQLRSADGASRGEANGSPSERRALSH
jgi:hypothetical protein